ncbi:MAG TPA: iron ABC transporter permease [Bryobacteraceae bacterium]|jgi:iron complex transport system permease protein|nr:iron ABC transporter permease [Bryobacteraceae bacterium]
MKPEKWIWLSLAILMVVAVTTPLIGSTHIDLRRAFAHVSPDYEIFFYARLPRVLLALIGGAALSVTGVLFQCMLRDPLAEPYTLGVSSGASVGAVLGICFGLRPIGLLSLAGAAAVLLIVVGIAVEGRRLSSFTLLLTGVTMNSMSFAVIMFLHNLATFSQSFAISRWLMGGLDAVEYSTLAWLAAAVVPVSVLVTLRAPQWNLLAIGDEWAASRGVSTTSLTMLGYVAGSILTGLVTALTGPIGFVGLIVPHALRIRLGADHRVLLPCSFLLGAAFLCVCDTLSRTVLAPTEIPVGVLTALAGGPFFIWLLRSRRRSLWL